MMKIYGILCIAVAIIMLLCPLAAIPFGSDSHTEESETQENTTKEASNTDSDTISVFMSEDEKTEEMDMRDYIIGTVAAEMPASYESEALKAQALAAVTFALYLKENGNNETMNGADISDDSSTHQGYMSKDEMQEKWGDAYETYYSKIENAVDSVIDKVITYDGEPIMAAYHAISTGKTESAENMWGKAIPYLVSVDSEGDKYSTRYSSSVTVTEKELKEALKNTDGAVFDSEVSMIKINSTTDSGTVTSADVCGVEMTGMEIRNLFSLRSPSFNVTYADGVYTFSVKGYGHGVGMSQYGADWYAKQGCTYEEIIEHYYPGTEIEER